MEIIIGITILFIILAMFNSVFTVEEQSAVIVERFGRYVRSALPGLNFKIPVIEKKAGRISFRVQQLDVKAETKTKDNVFVNLTVSVQYYVMKEKIADAFYKLNNPSSQINSYVYDVVRAKVPQLILDDLFESKDEIAMAVKSELETIMRNFGFGIVNVLATDVEPDMRVKNAMNEINAAQRMRVAATEKGEAEKILKVKLAQAEAESTALHGEGIAQQRKKIIEGLKDSVADFQTTVHGTTATQVMNIVMLTQYFDTLKEIAQSGKATTIMIPSNPGGVKSLESQIMDSMIVGSQIKTTE